MRAHPRMRPQPLVLYGRMWLPRDFTCFVLCDATTSVAQRRYVARTGSPTLRHPGAMQWVRPQGPQQGPKGAVAKLLRGWIVHMPSQLRAHNEATGMHVIDGMCIH